jgi:Predicted metal-dependent protease of the PAD1/JAB1 superfamily
MPKLIGNDTCDIEQKKRSVKSVSLYIHEFALNDMIHHAESGGTTEVMGLMLGNVYQDSDGRYAVTERIVTSKLIADEKSVKFDENDLTSLFESIGDLKGSVVTGWYHSHPGFGCFLSETDIRTHAGIFNGECAFALVIDPIRQEIKAFDSTPDDPKETMFIIVEDD